MAKQVRYLASLRDAPPTPTLPLEGGGSETRFEKSPPSSRGRAREGGKTKALLEAFDHMAIGWPETCS